MRRIVLADDTVDLRVLLTRALEAFGGFVVVGEAGNGREAVALVEQLQPDAILLDLSMPELDGLEAIPLLVEASPDTAIVVLSGFDARTFADEALARGAAAYVQKGTPLREVHRTLILACGGEAEDAQPRPSAAPPTDEALLVLSTLAHELRTPVAVAMGFAELLEDSVDRDPDRMRYAAAAILRAMRQINIVIENSLDARRIAAGTLQLNEESLDLAQLVEDLAGDLAPVANGRMLHVQPTGPVDVAADPGRLRQVLLNLMVNALRFAPKGSAIDVTVERNGHHAEVTVRDRGEGVPPGAEDAIFDRFWTSDQKQAGTGLGLYVARALAERHGGSLTHERPVDGGARFILRLPYSS